MNPGALQHADIELVHVVAYSQNRCIGKNNQLPWHLPGDLQHFKAITQGGVIVMGRKTLESMGRALPNRSNWVLTRQTDWAFSGVDVRHTLDSLLEDALTEVRAQGQQSLFIIGGGEIFQQTLPLADRLEVTEVDIQVDGEAYYPEIPKEFRLTQHAPQQDPASGIAYTFKQFLRE